MRSSALVNGTISNIKMAKKSLWMIMAIKNHSIVLKKQQIPTVLPQQSTNLKGKIKKSLNLIMQSNELPNKSNKMKRIRKQNQNKKRKTLKNRGYQTKGKISSRKNLIALKEVRSKLPLDLSNKLKINQKNTKTLKKMSRNRNLPNKGSKQPKKILRIKKIKLKKTLKMATKIISIQSTQKSEETD